MFDIETHCGVRADGFVKAEIERDGGLATG